MKYLKRFNEGTNTYYFEIDDFKWDTDITNGFIDINNELFKKIESSLNSKDYQLIKVDDFDVVGIEIESRINDDTCTIYKSDDDWFYVFYVFDERRGIENIKCDQEEGLMIFLKNYKIIK